MIYASFKCLVAILGVFVAGLFMAWVALNFMAGCDDWSRPECIKPGAFVLDLAR